jgi:alcohol dehydrogenase, propanol-preferring
MKALRLKQVGTVSVESVALPAVGHADVLLRVMAAGVCQTDVHIRHDPQQSTPSGTILGHEIAGEIVRLGGGVQNWRLGDRVVVHPCWACHVCAQCRAGRENACQGNGGRLRPPPTPGVSVNGGMAEYAVVPSSSIIGIGDLDPAVAAILADAGLAPYHSVRLLRERLTPGTTAVVIGVGGLGQFAVQILKLLTAAKIIALDVSDAALAMVADTADVTLRADSAEAAASVMAATQDLGAEAVIDLVGSDATLRLASSILAPYGAIQAIGLAGGSAPFETTLSSSIGLPWGATFMKPYSGSYRDLVEVIALARAGKLKATIQRFRLDEAVNALDALAAGRIRGRAVLIPTL